ncbi:hypothetical protein B0H14DRAFT_2640337 [Mycena olivaceomarginata]|nr:hypothetical protein B0H14DRAFT_2640337 [Mycena olivaceomarginata]
MPGLPQASASKRLVPQTTNAPRLPAPHRTQADIKSAGWQLVARGSHYWHQMFDQAQALCSVAQWNPDCHDSVGQCSAKPSKCCVAHLKCFFFTIWPLWVTLRPAGGGGRSVIVVMVKEKKRESITFELKDILGIVTTELDFSAFHEAVVGQLDEWSIQVGFVTDLFPSIKGSLETVVILGVALQIVEKSGITRFWTAPP